MRLIFASTEPGRYIAMNGGKVIAHARVHEDNYVATLSVQPEFRRKGVASALVAYIVKDRGAPLNRTPVDKKNAVASAFGRSAKATANFVG